MALAGWALPRLSHLLPLDQDSLKQIISYTDTLSKPGAAEHLKNLLGDSPQALEFISSFNTRRPNPAPEPASSKAAAGDASGSASEVPRAGPRPKKKKPAFNTLPPPRRVEDVGNVAGAYVKRDQDDYMAGRSRGRNQPHLSDTLALDTKPDATQLPLITGTTPAPPRPQHQQSLKLPPSASGTLISDALPSSRSASPASKAHPSKTKIALSGGTSMRGQSATLNDLDSAIRALEIQTNPSLAASVNSQEQENATRRRRCNCMAQRHALLTAAPNCLNCGKIVCAKEGLGPCTSCGAALLSSSDIQAMVKVLREERGREKQIATNAAHKRPDVARAPRPFSTTSTATTPATSTPASSDSESEKLSAAKLHRDRLLKFQTDNARRTRIHDEAADFDTPDSGTSMWATPQERALQLKRQQKVLREQEWSARPEFEKRRMVVSIDVVGGKAVKRMADVQRPDFNDVGSDGDGEDMDEPVVAQSNGGGGNGGKGTFSRNPLLGSLIRPVFRADGGGQADGKAKGKDAERKTTWRKVQDDGADNEQWILDGGAYGGDVEGRVLGAEERAVG